MPMSETARRALYARDGGGEVFLDLIRIFHSSWTAGPMRFVNNTSNITSRGNIYEAAPFEIPLPSQVEAGSPSLTIVLHNVDRLIESELAALTSEPRITYDCVLASAPDDLIFTYTFPLRSTVTTRNTITGTLGGVAPILTRSFPRDKFNSIDFPGLEGEGTGDPAEPDPGPGPGPGTPSISVTPTTLAAGAIATVVVAGGPGNTTDWVGLYTSDQHILISRKYLNGSTPTPPTTALTAATLEFRMPTPSGGSGNYKFYFLREPSHVLASTTVVTVTG